MKRTGLAEVLRSARTPTLNRGQVSTDSARKRLGAPSTSGAGSWAGFTAKKLTAASAALLFGLLYFSTIGATPASAARPACNSARVGRTFGSGPTLQTCRRIRSGSRYVYQWVIRVPPTTRPSSSGSPACLRGGWEARQGAEYWQSLLESKTGGAISLLKVVSGRKTMAFSGDYVTIMGNFVLTSLPVASDPDGPIITGIGNWDFSGSYHVSAGNLVADSSDIDIFDIKLTLNGTTVAAPPRLTSFAPGQMVPFTCSGDRLTIVEAGASGRTVTVEYTRRAAS